jgi:hypothetical protein
MAEAFAEQQEQADLANEQLAACMHDEEQMYVESLRRVKSGMATMVDVKILASGLKIDFNLI